MAGYQKTAAYYGENDQYKPKMNWGYNPQGYNPQGGYSSQGYGYGGSYVPPSFYNAAFSGQPSQGWQQPYQIGVGGIPQNQNLIPTIDPGGDPVKEAVKYSTNLGRNVQSEILPFLVSLYQDQYQLPRTAAYQELDPSGVPGQIDLLTTLKQIMPGFDPGQGTYKEGRYTAGGYTAGPRGSDFAPEFYGTKAITADVLKDPSFMAFKEQLTKATGESSRGIADEMARRGILSSGATKEQYERLSEASDRAIASKMGDIATPLIQKSLIQQNIVEPMRQTTFDEMRQKFGYGAGMEEARRETGYGEREGARRTGYDLTQQQREEQSLKDMLSRVMGIGTSTQEQRQDYENMLSNLMRSEGGRSQDYAQEELDRNVYADQVAMNRFAEIQNLINSAMTGSQAGGGISDLLRQQQLEQQKSQFGQSQQFKEDVDQRNMYMQIARLIPQAVQTYKDW